MSDIKSFSQALESLESHGVEVEPLGTDEKTRKLIWRVGELEYDKAGIIGLAREYASRPVPALSIEMQTLAQGYIDARKRAGAALLDQARFLALARDAAKHGEWSIFLEATQTSEDWAGRLLNIHDTAERDPRFADAIRSNFLNLSTAYELASSPTDLRDRLLSAAEPPTVKEIREEKRAANSATSRNLGPGQPEPEPWPDAPEGWRWNRKGAPAHLIAPGGWRTADYNYPERALAEAQQYMLTLSPFWQSLDAHHPTAHFWTRERPDLLRSACGMTIQNRLPSGSREAGHCSSCVRATWKEPPTIRVTFRHSRDRIETDLDDGLHAQLAALGFTWESAAVTPDGRWHHVVRSHNRALLRNEGERMRIERLEALARNTVGQRADPNAADSKVPPPAAPDWTQTCVRCGKGRDLHRQLTSYGAGLVPEYPDRAVTLCSTCIPELLRARKQATPPDLAQLDRELPKELERAGYYWHSASPPEIRHNDGWRGDAPTVAGTLQLAYDRARSKIAATVPEVAPAPAAAAVDWNVVARESYRIGARESTAEAWVAIGNIIRLLAGSDRASAITWLLTEAAALAGDHLEDLADELDDAEYEALARLLRPVKSEAASA